MMMKMPKIHSNLKPLNIPVKSLSSLLLEEMNVIKSRIQNNEYLKESKNSDAKEFAFYIEETYNEVLEKIKKKINSANVNKKIKFLQDLDIT